GDARWAGVADALALTDATGVVARLRRVAAHRVAADAGVAVPGLALVAVGAGGTGGVLGHALVDVQVAEVGRLALRVVAARGAAGAVRAVEVGAAGVLLGAGAGAVAVEGADGRVHRAVAGAAVGSRGRVVARALAVAGAGAGGHVVARRRRRR